MSKFDRVDVGTLSRCCITAIQAHAGPSTDRELVTCPQCGDRLVFLGRVWRSARLLDEPQREAT